MYTIQDTHSLTIGPANSFSCFISGSVNIPLNVVKTAVDNTVNHRNACMTMRERSKRRQVRSYDIYSLESRSASGGTVTVYIDTWFVVECVPLSSIPQLLWAPATSRLNLHDQQASKPTTKEQNTRAPKALDVLLVNDTPRHPCSWNWGDKYAVSRNLIMPASSMDTSSSSLTN